MWFIVQLSTLPNIEPVKGYPHFTLMILIGTGVHLIIVATLLVLLLQRNRIATLLLGTWFTLTAPLLLAVLFDLSKISFLLIAIACEVASFSLWRYAKIWVNGHEKHLGVKLPFSVKIRMSALGVIAVGVISLSLTNNYLVATALTLLPMFFLWAMSDDDTAVVASFLCSTNGFLGVLVVLMALGTRNIDWYDVGMGFAWMFTGVIIWAMAIAILKLPGRRQRKLMA